jgi:hypothetical protein
VGVRQQRRGPPRPLPVPGLLPAGRPRGIAHPVRHRHILGRAEHRRERRDRGRPRCVRAALPAGPRPDGVPAPDLLLRRPGARGPGPARVVRAPGDRRVGVARGPRPGLRGRVLRAHRRVRGRRPDGAAVPARRPSRNAPRPRPRETVSTRRSGERGLDPRAEVGRCASAGPGYESVAGGSGRPSTSSTSRPPSSAAFAANGATGGCRPPATSPLSISNSRATRSQRTR